MEASLAASRCRWSSRHSAVSTTDVTIPGRVTTPPIVQTAPSPVRFAISRISSSSFAAPARASRRLPPERHLMPLDTERAKHYPQRQLERLQHRTLLDVQLEVGRRVLQLTPR